MKTSSKLIYRNGVLTFAQYKNPPKISASLSEIKAATPCFIGWNKLVSFLNTATEEPEWASRHAQVQIDYRVFLVSNGIRDTIWACRCKWFEGQDIWMKVLNAAINRVKKHEAVNANIDAVRAAGEASAAYAAAAAAERKAQTKSLLALLS